jgi:hypothetical protein
LDLIYRSSCGLSGYGGLSNRALSDITMYCDYSYRENIGEYKREHQGSALKAVECLAAQQKAVHKNKGNG